MSRLDEEKVRDIIKDPDRRNKVIRKEAGFLTDANTTGGVVPQEESVKEGGPQTSSPFPNSVKVIMQEPDENAPRNEDGRPATRKTLHMFPTGDKNNKLQEIHDINPEKYDQVAQQVSQKTGQEDTSDYKQVSADKTDLEEENVDDGVYNVPIEQALADKEQDEAVEEAANQIENEKEGEEMQMEENTEPVDAWLSCNGMSMYTQYRDIQVNERAGFLVLFYKKGDTGLVTPQPGVQVDISTEITEPGTYIFDKDFELPFGEYRACVMEQCNQQDKSE